ncbi:hypothetical protein F0562_003847 [Nyssa sinensis]|uniref:Endonuclease/exonuclease/phosphatase domain-containing protein n=1 Tax=Nyssa sinensis TaxID=561372 RepID=A0A5J5BW92_9ASTE|nr:hypothetical protein F0562_003847 [Nyssa sinensis]
MIPTTMLPLVDSCKFSSEDGVLESRPAIDTQGQLTRTSEHSLRKWKRRARAGGVYGASSLGEQVSVPENNTMILYDHEKLGASHRPLWQMRDFRSVLNDCGLRDLSYCGFDFTWSNNRALPHSIGERLDRFVVSMDWMNAFSMASVFHPSSYYSDHWPMWMDTKTDGRTNQASRKKKFRFEANVDS